jgi:hypothetical protein
MKTSRKIILTVVLTMASAMGLNAQDEVNTTNTAEDRIRLGVKGGMNYSNVYDERGDDFVADGKVGLAAGAFLSIPIGKFLGIQPEFMISQKGFRGSGSISGFNYGLTRTSTFIDVPVFVSLRPIPFLSVMAGPQFSYLLNQRDEFTSTLGGFDIEQEFDNDDIRKNMMCFVGGVDFNFSHVVIGARAGFDFQNNRGDGTSSTPRYKNTWVQGTVGLRL